ncbi:centrosomal protein of 131 kDa isoform X2 [Stigmatopora nigra]
MHTTRSPSSISAVPPGDVLDLSLSGSRLSICKRPGGTSPVKFLARSVSVSAGCDVRGKRNTLSDTLGSSRSVKNLRRSNSSTHVNQHSHVPLSSDHHGVAEYLTVLDTGESRKKPDGNTWNILDEQPRAPDRTAGVRGSPGADLPGGMKRRHTAASFTANNRSNKGAVGNTVTTILHNNHGDKPLTPKSFNQKPPFNNILKANDHISLETGSLTKSQKNFSSASSNNKSPAGRGSPHPQRRDQVSEEEAERFIQQVNQAAVTIQRWYRRHAGRRCANRAALQHILDTKRKEWRERAEADCHPEPPRDDRKLIREEKARQARLTAIQELQQKRAKQVPPSHCQDRHYRRAGANAERQRQSGTTPSSPAYDNVSPTRAKTNNSDFHQNIAGNLSELTFRAVSPPSFNHSASPCSQLFQECDDINEEEDGCLDQHQDNDRKSSRQARPRLSRLTIPEPYVCDDLQPLSQAEAEYHRPLSARSPTSPSNICPMVVVDSLKAKNTECVRNLPSDTGELSCFRAVSPSLSSRAGSQCSQGHPRRCMFNDDRSCAASKSTLNELLDTLKLLEEEPEHPSESKSYNKEKYAWLDEDIDGGLLTADNLERHVRLELPPPADGAALLSEAKLQSIMNFLDEMEKSEQERPHSSVSHREAVFLEEEVSAMDPASAAAAQVSDSIMRIKMELEEKKRVVEMLQNALTQQRELTVQHVKETEKELNRNLQLQKDQYEATVQRHLTFIDQLIGDKKALSERCEGVIAELKLVDHKYTKKISQMQEQHEMVWQVLAPLCEEIKKLKELMSVTEKIRREKWIDEKTKKIKEITVKGLEPEIQKLISKHKLELKKLRSLHEAELLRSEERGAEHCARQCGELRQQLERDMEEQCGKERQLARDHFQKQLREEELSLQEYRRRLQKDAADEKDRLERQADRQRSEMEELRRRMEENSCVAGRVFRQELDKTREEQERRHQAEIKKMQESFEQEKMTWEEEYRKKQESGLLRHERQLREELRQERDKEIQLAIWTLEEETNKDKEDFERATQNRVNRVRETYEAELKELERSLKESADKQQELRRQHADVLQQLEVLGERLGQKEQDALAITQDRDQLLEERHTATSLIRQEFATRLLVLEEEAQRARADTEEVRTALRAEVERITREKEDELHQVHQRVKTAILKKDEAVSVLRKQHEAAVKRAEHLEALWEDQRKQLLEK